MKLRQGVDLSTRDYQGYRESMIEQLKQKIPEYSDFSSSDMGIVLIELLATQLDSLSYYLDKVTNELFLDTAYEKESVSRLAKMIGYEMAESTPAKYLQVFEITPQTKPILIPRGTVITTEDASYERQITFEVEEDLIIPEGCTGLEKDEEGNYLYSTVVVEGETISQEILGTGYGIADQTFDIYYYPVIYDSVKVSVTDFSGTREWTQVKNFISSDSQSTHYTLTLSEEGIGTIKFGNGISGKIPTSIEDGITVTYRVGGGTEGNVGINTITKMINKPAVVKRTFNPFEAFERGTDSESVDVVRVKAPASLGTKYGIVTLNDYKNLALSTNGVLRANSVVIDDTRVLVEIYYVLDEGVNEDKVLEELVIEYNERKMLGTKFRLVEGEKVPLDVTVDLKMFATGDRNYIRSQVEEYFNTNLKLGALDFEEIPESSDFIPDLLNIVGVRSANVNFPEVSLKENQIIELGDLRINILGEERYRL